MKNLFYIILLLSSIQARAQKTLRIREYEGYYQEYYKMLIKENRSNHSTDLDTTLISATIKHVDSIYLKIRKEKIKDSLLRISDSLEYIANYNLARKELKQLNTELHIGKATNSYKTFYLEKKDGSVPNTNPTTQDPIYLIPQSSLYNKQINNIIFTEIEGHDSIQLKVLRKYILKKLIIYKNDGFPDADGDGVADREDIIDTGVTAVMVPNRPVSEAQKRRNALLHDKNRNALKQIEILSGQFQKIKKNPPLTKDEYLYFEVKQGYNTEEQLLVSRNNYIRLLSSELNK